MRWTDWALAQASPTCSAAHLRPADRRDARAGACPFLPASPPGTGHVAQPRTLPGQAITRAGDSSWSGDADQRSAALHRLHQQGAARPAVRADRSRRAAAGCAPCRGESTDLRKRPAVTPALQTRLVAATMGRRSVAPCIADPHQLLRSNNAQQLGSAGGRDSSPISSRNSVPRCAVSSRPSLVLTVPEKAPRSAKELALNQVLSQRGAVERDQRIFSPLRSMVQGGRRSLPTPVRHAPAPAGR